MHIRVKDVTEIVGETTWGKWYWVRNDRVLGAKRPRVRRNDLAAGDDLGAVLGAKRLVTPYLDDCNYLNKRAMQAKFRSRFKMVGERCM